MPNPDLNYPQEWLYNATALYRIRHAHPVVDQARFRSAMAAELASTAGAVPADPNSLTLSLGPEQSDRYSPTNASRYLPTDFVSSVITAPRYFLTVRIKFKTPVAPTTFGALARAIARAVFQSLRFNRPDPYLSRNMSLLPSDGGLYYSRLITGNRDEDAVVVAGQLEVSGERQLTPQEVAQARGTRPTPSAPSTPSRPPSSPPTPGAACQVPAPEVFYLRGVLSAARSGPRFAAGTRIQLLTAYDPPIGNNRLWRVKVLNTGAEGYVLFRDGRVSCPSVPVEPHNLGGGTTRPAPSPTPSRPAPAPAPATPLPSAPPAPPAPPATLSTTPPPLTPEQRRKREERLVNITLVGGAGLVLASAIWVWRDSLFGSSGQPQEGQEDEARPTSPLVRSNPGGGLAALTWDPSETAWRLQVLVNGHVIARELLRAGEAHRAYTGTSIFEAEEQVQDYLRAKAFDPRDFRLQEG